MKMHFSTSVIMAATVGVLAFAAPLGNTVNGPDALVDNMQPRMLALAAPPVTGDALNKRQTYYPDCGAPICFDTAGTAYENKQKRDVTDAVAEESPVKRYNPKYYPDCGAPICFNEAGTAYENKQKRDVTAAVTGDILNKRQTYYPDCGAPICFDEAGIAYKNKQKRDVTDTVVEDELVTRYNPKYYPDCGAPICFDVAGKAYVNKA